MHWPNQGLILALVIAMLMHGNTARAHGGGLDGNGCHNNRKTGDYHCHRNGPGIPVQPRFLVAPLPRIIRAPTPIVRGPTVNYLPAIVIPSRADLVSRIQEGLARLGYDLPSADNIMGPKTQFAIMKFQEAEAIRIDGTASLDLLTLIDAKIALGAVEEAVKR